MRLLHEELRRAREEADLTQAALAKLAGIPRNQVVRAERGENITIGTLRKIAAYLPVERLTLLDKIQLEVDILPHAEKVYFGSMDALFQLLRAIQLSLSVTMDARDAWVVARRDEPLSPEATVQSNVDDSLLFTRLFGALEQLGEKLKNTAQTG